MAETITPILPNNYSGYTDSIKKLLRDSLKELLLFSVPYFLMGFDFREIAYSSPCVKRINGISQ